MDAVPGAGGGKDPLPIREESPHVQQAQVPLLRQAADEPVDREAVLRREAVRSGQRRVYGRRGAEPQARLRLQLGDGVQKALEIRAEILRIIPHLIGTEDQHDVLVRLAAQTAIRGDAALVSVAAAGAQAGDYTASVGKAVVRPGQLPVHGEAAAVGIAQQEGVGQPIVLRDIPQEPIRRV